MDADKGMELKPEKRKKWYRSTVLTLPEIGGLVIYIRWQNPLEPSARERKLLDTKGEARLLLSQPTCMSLTFKCMYTYKHTAKTHVWLLLHLPSGTFFTISARPAPCKRQR